MKTSTIITLVQSLVLLIVTYQWISLTNSSSKNNHHSHTSQQESDKREEACDTQIVKIEYAQFNQDLKSFIRDELKKSYSNNPIELTKQSLPSHKEPIGDVEVLEKLTYKINDFRSSGEMSNSEMENIFSQFGRLNKEQRYEIRKLLAQSINSGQIKKIN